MDAPLAKLSKRVSGAAQSSPETISCLRGSLRSPDFGRNQVPVELFVIDELEEFRRGVELVGRPDVKRQGGDLASVFVRFSRGAL
eukprot:2059379-Pyramimonas_sp.AAC.1